MRNCKVGKYRNNYVRHFSCQISKDMKRFLAGFWWSYRDYHEVSKNKTSFHLHIQSKELYRGYHIWQGHESQSQVLVFIYFWKWGNGLPAWNNKFRDPHVNYSFGSWLESHLIFLNNKVQIMFLIDQKIKQNSGFPLNQLLYGRKVWIVSTESIQAGILNESSMYNCYFVIYATQNDLNKTLQN